MKPRIQLHKKSTGPQPVMYKKRHAHTPIARIVFTLLAIIAIVPSLLFVGVQPASAAEGLLISHSITEGTPPFDVGDEEFTYTISYSCSGTTTPCEDVVVYFEIPDEYEYIVATHLPQSGIYYDPNTDTWSLGDVPPGPSKELELTVRFKGDGTVVDGTIVTTAPTANASNFPLVTSDPVTAEANAENTDFSANKDIASGGKLLVEQHPGTNTSDDTEASDITYDITVCQPPNSDKGGVNLTATITDTLPEEARYVSHTEGGDTFKCDGSSVCTLGTDYDIVTWEIEVPVGSGTQCATRQLTLRFPAGTLTESTPKTNSIEVTAKDPALNPLATIPSDSVAITPRVPDINTAINKSVTSSIPTGGVLVGGSVTYKINAQNLATSEVPVDNFVIEDTIDGQLKVTQIRARNVGGIVPTVSYKIGAGSWTPATFDDPNCATGSDKNCTVDVSGISNITALQWDYGDDIPAGFNTNDGNGNGFVAEVLNAIPNDPIPNTATLHSENGNQNYDVTSAVANVDVAAPDPKSSIATTRVANNIPLCQTAQFKITARNTGNVPQNDFTIIDTVDDNLDVLTIRTRTSASTSGTNPVYLEYSPDSTGDTSWNLIATYTAADNSPQALDVSAYNIKRIRWRYGTVPANFNSNNGNGTGITARVLATGTIPNDTSLTSTYTTTVTPDPDTDVDLTAIVASATHSISKSYTPSGASTSTPGVGADVTYDIVAKNTGNVPLDDFVITDEGIVPSQLKVLQIKARKVSGNTPTVSYDTNNSGTWTEITTLSCDSGADADCTADVSGIANITDLKWDYGVGNNEVATNFTTGGGDGTGFVARLHSVSENTVINNTAEVDSIYDNTCSVGDPGPGSGPANFNVAAAAHNSSIAKTLSPDNVPPWSSTTYSIDAENSSNIPLDSFVISDTIDPNLQVTKINARVNGIPAVPVTVSYSTNDGGTWTDQTFSSRGNHSIDVSGVSPNITNIKWDYGTVPNGFVTTGGTGTGFVAMVLNHVPTTGIPNTAELSSTQDGTRTDDAKLTTVAPTTTNNATISKSVNPTSSAVDGTVTYSIDAENTGNVPLDKFVITDAISPQLQVTQINVHASGSAPVKVSYKEGGSWTILGPYSSDTTLNAPTHFPENGITDLKWDYVDGVPLGFDTTDGSGTGFEATVLSDEPADPIPNTAQLESQYLISPIQTKTSAPVNLDVLAYPRPTITKDSNMTGVARKGYTVGYTIQLGNTSPNNTNLRNPVLADFLPAGIEYVGNVVVAYNGGTAPTVGVESITNYKTSGRTLVRFYMDGTNDSTAFNLPKGKTLTIEFDALVGPSAQAGNSDNSATLIDWDNTDIDLGTSPPQDSNDLDDDGDTTEPIKTSTAERVVIQSYASLDSAKWVKGELDTKFSRYPDVGFTVLGGDIEYLLEVENTGTIPMKDVDLVDIMPYVGDTGVIDTSPRSTRWQPQFTRLIQVPAGVTVYYSTEQKPCRNATSPPNLLSGVSPPSCQPPNWTTIPPADSTTVKSFRISFGSTILYPGDKFQVRWLMSAPADAPTTGIIDSEHPENDIRTAWNSFGYIATRNDNNTIMLPAEPLKVGIAVSSTNKAALGNYVWIDANDNGIQDDGDTNGVDLVRVDLYTPGDDGIAGNGDDIPVVTNRPTARNDDNEPGYYIFDNLDAGDYYLRFYPPVGYDVITPDQGSDDALDSDVFLDGDIYRTPIITLADDTKDLTWDMGLVEKPTAAVGNYVWFDRDGEGDQDEPSSDGINGVKVELLDSNGVVTATTTTDFDAGGKPGYYLFDDLEPGTYSLRFTLPTGATFTSQDATGGSITDASDSDPDTTTGKTDQFTLAGGDYDDTWDAGIIMPTGSLSLGNLVWLDSNNDGQYGSGEAGVDDVVVNLYRDTNDDNEFTPGTDEFYATMKTFTKGGQPGYYLFDDLPAGKYIVQIDPSNFLGGGPLNGLASSTGNNVSGTAPDPDNDVNHDDNGDPYTNYGGVSKAVDLAAGDEPTDDGDTDNNSNLTVDFGFYPVVALGNLVWNDGNNNGEVDAGETGIPGVLVELYRDDGDGTFDPDTDTFVANDTTDDSGLYLFEDLPAGNYFVRIPESNFAGSEALVNYINSTGNDVSGSAPSPEDNVNSDDNGDTVVGQGVVSKMITLAPDTEPTNDGDNDNSTNLTVDFGFYSLSLGNRVWDDLNNNGLIDGDEAGIEDVLVNLYRSGETTPLATMTTDANGHYLFDNLAPGDYVVELDTSNFTGSGALLNYRSSTGTPGQNVGTYETAPDPDSTTTDSDDNGSHNGALGSTGFSIRSSAVTLAHNSMPTGETDLGDLGAGQGDANSNLTVDFGVYRPLSLGNRVWDDPNNNGTIDTGESGVSGVTVNLYEDSNGNGTIDIDETTPISTTTTDASGYYLFDNLKPITYVVELATSNFASGGPLEGYNSSTGTNNTSEPAPDPNTDADDSDDNGTTEGTLGSGGSIQSAPVMLSHNSEPTSETDLGTDGTGSATNANSNLTVDFGVVRPLSLGNRVWNDNNNNNGTIDDGETGMADVTVNLYFDADGDGEITGAETTPVQTDTTDSNGYYLFDKLLPGDYVVELASDNFTASTGTLAGYTSSTGNDSEPAPDSDANADDSDDNGTLDTTAGALGSGGTIRSAPVTLSHTDEPADETDKGPDGTNGAGLAQDTDSNITVDFGVFVPLSLGNRVWDDINNNGTIDTGEAGMDGVKVNLYFDADNNGELDGTEATTPLSTTTTADGGYYLFDLLGEGNYMVELDDGNFTGSNVLAEYTSSTGTNGKTSGMYEPAPDPNNDVDRYDDGSINGTLGSSGGTIQSDLVTLNLTKEPTNETDTGTLGSGSADNNNSNITIDFGVYRPLSLGNRVWKDLNNNGVIDDDADGNEEPGVADVAVNLYHDIDGDGSLVGSEQTPIATTTTDENGYYLFDNLAPGDYIVELDGDNFTSNGPLVGYSSSTGSIVVNEGDYEPAPDPDPNDDDEDDNTDSNDNGTINGSLGNGGGVRSLPVTLTHNEEPTGEPDRGTHGSGNASDHNSNLTVDFGVYPLLSLGNRVWADTNNNGLIDDDEDGISDVLVQLYRDVDGNGELNGDETTPIAITTTGADGYYIFENLLPGDYMVALANSNFTEDGILATYTSSTGTNGATTGDYEPAPDADDTPTDSDDNGSINDTLGSATGDIRSKLVTLDYGTEPKGETDVNLLTSGRATDDYNNFTVDFGLFQPLSLGNRVWKDTNDNGIQDTGEQGINGVAVVLYQDSNHNGTFDPNTDTKIAETTTSGTGDNAGFYQFPNLLPGDFIVQIPQANFANGGALNGLNSSIGNNDAITGKAPDPDTNTDKDDNGDWQDGQGVVSTAVSLALGKEPTNDGDEDANTNYTVDFGFAETAALGNYVWFDRNGDGTQNEAAADGLNGVTVHLYDTKGNRIASTVTGEDANGNPGYYLFDGLKPGDYIVQFELPEGATFTSYGTTGSSDPDDSDVSPVDRRTETITLAAGDRDMTWDAGIILPQGPLSLGNYVWQEIDNDGIYERGADEKGINGVRVYLYRDSNHNGVPDPAEYFMATDTKQHNGEDGFYQFTNLPPGEYIVVVPESNFADDGVLNKYASTIGNNTADGTAPDPDDNTNNDDNGTPVEGYGVISKPIFLSEGAEPTNDGDSDANSNLSVDFGFYQLVSLGNRVWRDANNNGIYEPKLGEVGINGVTLKLYRDSNNNGVLDNSDEPAIVDIQTTTNDANGEPGYYRFTNIPPATYIVQVEDANFGNGGPLYEFFSSTGNDDANGKAPNADNDTDNDDNGNTRQTGKGVVSSAITLMVGEEPNADIDGDGTDDNMTVDFGFHKNLSLGNHIWHDTNNNGIYEPALGEQGINGVVINLYQDLNGDGEIEPSEQVGEPFTTRNEQGLDGYYTFEDLLPGDYIIQVAPANFADGGVLEGMEGSTSPGIPPEDDSPVDPDDDVNMDDNGGARSENGVVSLPVTLTDNDEPIDDGDGRNGNKSVDFGFHDMLTLGNRVWKDTNNNGVQDAGEQGINDVRVMLYHDANNNGMFDPASDTYLAETLTSGSGDTQGTYSFDNLVPGDYIVQIAESNFAEGSPLYGLATSTGNNDEHHKAPDPDNDIDLDDNGCWKDSHGVVSQAVTLTDDAEPTDDGDNDPDSNLTVDFGFNSLASIGNYVWHDRNKDGIQNESLLDGLNGVTVNLYNEAGKLIATTITEDDDDGKPGFYLFDGLQPGQYAVEVVLPKDATFTTQGETGSSDAEDSDIAPETGRSEVFTINTGDYDLSWDAGIVMPTGPLSLGNRVWLDADMNGMYDPDSGEIGVNDVRLDLYRDLNGNGQPDNGEFFAATITTPQDGEAGYYDFTDLPADDYIVVIPAINFAEETSPLYGRMSTVNPNDANGLSPDPDNNTDSDDNGDMAEDGSVVSKPITLSVGNEPTNDGDNDANSNMTVDFGFVRLLSLGNRIWRDTNNNGIQDAGEEGINGVTLKLYQDTNNNGVYDEGDTPVDTPMVTTKNDDNGMPGYYMFDQLVPGHYIVQVHDSNFDFGSPLNNMFSSTGNDDDSGNAPDPDDDQNNDDNGNTYQPGQGVFSSAITLLAGTEPDVDSDCDCKNSNMTLDFGFAQYLVLGDNVWFDANNNGVFEPSKGEKGINDVLVNLYRDVNGDGIPQASEQVGEPFTTRTEEGIDGYYLFEQLIPDDYIVQIDPANFEAGGALEGMASSTGSGYQAAPDNPSDPDDNVNRDDDGGARGEYGVMSQPITLESDAEPENDGDDSNGNLTVDFGFYQTLSLGNRVWLDTNNNGIIDDGEAGINDVEVLLYHDTNGNGRFDAVSDTLVDQTITTSRDDAAGYYRFDNLLPGDYIVQIASDNFDQGGALQGLISSSGNNDIFGMAPDPDDDADNDDNGNHQSTYGVLNTPVTLSYNDEPTNDGDENPNSNMSVDFGFVATAAVGNYVWYDRNNDGLQNEPAEDGVNGIIVKLHDADGNLVATTTTHDDTSGNPGFYRFDGLEPGDYTIQFVLPDGSKFTTADAGTNSESSDSDANPNTGSTSTITLAAGDYDMTWDAGIVLPEEPLSLGNLVWKDANNNGIVDSGEQGINDVLVQLYYDTNGNGLYDGSDTFVAQTTTSGTGDNAGTYRFDSLAPGEYVVVIPDTNFGEGGSLSGLSSSTGNNDARGLAPDPDNDTNNDDNGNADERYGVVSSAVTLAHNTEPTNDGDDDANTNLSVDFGFAATSSVGNYVWNDLNSDGIQNEAPEEGVNGIVVHLYDADGNIVATAVTHDDGKGNPGYYRFDGLAAGDYSLAFVLPDGAEFTATNASGSSATNDSDAGTNGRTPTFTLGENEADMTWDAGLILPEEPLSLGNRVWRDSNNNGIIDEDEAGINGVLVELYYDTNGNGIYDGADTFLTNTTTSSSGENAGFYTFTDLVPGDYVVLIPAANFVEGGPLYNLNSSTGNNDMRGMAPDPDDDTDSDDNGGYRDAYGVSSAAVTLNYNDEPTNDGDDNASSNLSVDFGFANTSSVGNYVWNDRNKDGIQNEAPTDGINGVTVKLYDADGNLVATTTTHNDADGNPGYYHFEGLQPGDYSIEFVLPDGTTFTPSNAEGSNAANDSDAGTNGRTPTFTLGANDHDMTWDAGLILPEEPLSLGNLVWLDSNNNGIVDSDEAEAGITGVLVELYQDTNNNGIFDAGDTFVAQTTTSGTGNDTGTYQFTNLVPGDYIVVIPPSNFVKGKPLYQLNSSTGNDDARGQAPDPDDNTNDDDNGTPDTRYGVVSTAVTLEYNDEPTNDGDDNASSNLSVDFGFAATASVGNYVWNDRNGDGIQNEAPEDGINGVVVRLYDADGKVIAVTVTHDDANGNPGYYVFEGLQPGDYSLAFVLPDGTTFTPANAEGSNTANDSDAGTNGRTPTFTLGANAFDMTWDAGLILPDEPLSLGNLVWLDSNNNGIVDADEANTGINGVLVELYYDTNGNGVYDEGDTYLTHTTTSGDGAEAGTYRFTDLIPGDYVVVIPDANFGEGQPLHNLNSSTGNNNAYGQAPDPDDNTNNDDNGTSNTRYGVVASNAVTLSYNDEPTNDGDESASSNLTVDFGFAATASVGNYVWHDRNKDGIQNEAPEDGMNGVTVKLYDADGNLVATTTTHDDANGNPGYYHFEGLQPGDYSLAFVLPDGTTFTPANADGSNAANDSDAGTNGRTPTFTLGANDHDMTWDAGLILPGEPLSLGNLVWLDTNNNGIVDSGEIGINGVLVELYQDSNNNGIYDVGDAFVAQTYTSGSGAEAGSYDFTNLVPGNYVVVLPTANFAPGSPLYQLNSSTGNNTTNGLAPDPDDDVNHDDNGTPDTRYGVVSTAVTLEYNDEPTNDGDDNANSNLTVDFGFAATASVGNYVWNDRNKDGIQNEAPEDGINGVVVKLYDADGNVVATTVTHDDANGNPGYYVFEGLQPGDYSLAFVLPDGTTFTPANAEGSNTANDSDAGTNGRTPTFTLGANAFDMTWDAGLILPDEPLSLGNLVWLDSNNNGIVDADEANTGINGVLVELYYDTNGNGVYDEGDTFLTQTMTSGDGAEAGSYQFTNLVPGDYIVVISAANFAEGKPLHKLNSSTGNNNAYGQAPDPDDNTNNDDNGTSNTRYGVVASNAVTLSYNDEPTNDGDESANSNLTVDFGFAATASVGNYVWHDRNKDGIQNESPEDGMNGVTVKLYDADGNLVATTTTHDDANGNPGYYHFEGLQPGDYSLAFVLPDGTTFTPSNAEGSNAANDSDAGMNGRTPTFTLGANDHDMTWDAGLILPGEPLSLGNLVWLDTNNNGIVDSGEIGINGVLVELYQDSNNNGIYDVGDAFVAQTYTSGSGAEAGSYDFTNLVPGNYVVVLPTANFAPGSPLYQLNSSTGNNTTNGLAPDPDDDVNHDDNGTPDTRYGVVSNAVTLAYNEEPTNDGDENASSNLSVDFGFAATASVGNYVWNDRNGDGIQNESPQDGINGVVVKLYDADGNVVATTVTHDDANGNPGYYVFEGLQPGDYSLAFVLPDGTTFTPANAEGSNTANDSDAGTNGRTPTFTLGANAFDMTWDAGLILPDEPLSLGNLVWLDSNNNGIRDEGETGINGVLVQLYYDINGNGRYDEGDILVAQTFTSGSGDDAGTYTFTNLVPGNYIVLIAQSNFAEGAPLYGLTSSTSNNYSHGYAPSPNSGVITLVAQSFLDADFGFVSGGIALNPGIELDKTISLARVVPYQVVTYTIKITNTSNNVLLSPVILTDTMDSGLTYMPDTAIPFDPSTVKGQTLVWDDITQGAGLAPGQSMTFEFLATVTAEIGTYVNTAIVEGRHPDGSVQDDDDATVGVGDPSVDVNKQFLEPGFVNGEITYTIRISNTGPSKIDLLPLIDHFEGPIAYVRGTPEPDTIDNEEQVLAWNNLVDQLGYLKPDESYTVVTVFRLTEDVADSDVINNIATVPRASDEFGNSVSEQSSSTVTAPPAPTAIELLNFTARYRAGDTPSVELRWVTGLELDTWGFHLWRSVDGSRASAIRVTPEIIAAQGRGTMGASYRWYDTDVQEGTRYTYWLEEIELDGSSKMYGPAAWVTATQGTERVYLPFVMR